MAQPQQLLGAVSHSLKCIARILTKHTPRTDLLCELAVQSRTMDPNSSIAPLGIMGTNSSIAALGIMGDFSIVSMGDFSKVPVGDLIATPGERSIAEKLGQMIRWTHAYKAANVATLPASVSLVFRELREFGVDWVRANPLMALRCFEGACVLSSSDPHAWFALAAFAHSLGQRTIAYITYALANSALLHTLCTLFTLLHTLCMLIPISSCTRKFGMHIGT